MSKDRISLVKDFMISFNHCTVWSNDSITGEKVNANNIIQSVNTVIESLTNMCTIKLLMMFHHCIALFNHRMEVTMIEYQFALAE